MSEPTKPRRAPSIKIAFQTLGRSLRHGYDNLWTLLVVSVFWYAGAIFILPLGVVTAGLHRVTKPMTEERSTTWRNFFQHARTDLRWSSLLAAILAFGFILIQVNLRFYSERVGLLPQMITILLLTGILVWLGITMFAFPLALRQREQHISTTMRNAVLITIANTPGVLVSLVLLGLLCTLLLLIPPLFIILPGVIALWGQENARLLLVASGYIAKDEIADREHPPR